MIMLEPKIKPITSLDDARLVKIDPQSPNFFKSVLDFETEDLQMQNFINWAKKAKEANIEAFYIARYDPAEEEENDEIRIGFECGKKLALGHSFNWWQENVKKIPAVEGRVWKLANEYHYCIFLIWLINQLVINGYDLEGARRAVVIDSQSLGNYSINRDIRKDLLTKTGKKCICGIFDLANVYKILDDTHQEGFFWASGMYLSTGEEEPLAKLSYGTYKDCDYGESVGFLIL